MAPHDALMNLLLASDDRDYDRCQQYIDDLKSWFKRGGFSPQLEIGSPTRLGRAQLKDTASRTVCLGICESIESAIAKRRSAPTIDDDLRPQL